MRVHYAFIQNKTPRLWLCKLNELGIIEPAFGVVTNTIGKHDKYYRVRILSKQSGRIEYGRTGAKAKTLAKPWDYIECKFDEKIRKGYEESMRYREVHTVAAYSQVIKMATAAGLPQVIRDMVQTIDIDFGDQQLSFRDGNDGLITRMHLPL